MNVIIRGAIIKILMLTDMFYNASQNLGSIKDILKAMEDFSVTQEPRILHRRVLDLSKGSTYIGNQKFLAVIKARDNRLALRHKVVVMDVVGQQQHLYRWRMRKQKNMRALATSEGAMFPGGFPS